MSRKTIANSIAIFFVGLSTCGLVTGQTIDEISKVLTPTANQNQFLINDVSVFVSFGGDGQICEAAWPSSGYGGRGMLLGVSKVQKQDVVSVFDLLAPPSIRGTVAHGGRVVTSITGNGGGYNFEFEHVNLTIGINTRSRYTGLTLDELISNARPAIGSPKGADPANEIVGDVAVLSWTNHRCYR